MTIKVTVRALAAVSFLLVTSRVDCFAIGTIVGGEKAGSDTKAPLELAPNATQAPKVGAQAPEVIWTDSDGKQHSLKKLTEKGPVVLLVLRGWPGYQCGICKRQVGEFMERKSEFERLGAEVVMIYPGPAELLKEHAKEFQAKHIFTGSFHYVIDPDYRFTNAWGLRWDAPRETAYPATYIVGKGNKVTFAAVSKSHGGRTKASKILTELQE